MRLWDRTAWMAIALAAIAACSGSRARKGDGGSDSSLDDAVHDGPTDAMASKDTPTGTQEIADGSAGGDGASDGTRPPDATMSDAVADATTSDAVAPPDATTFDAVARRDGETVVTSHVLASTVCSATGWCESNDVSDGSTPKPDDLGAVWGSGPNDDVWAVGSRAHEAVAVRWDGAAWTQSTFDKPVPVAAPNLGEVDRLDGVWGSGPRDVWAVGAFGYGDEILHWDGLGWASWLTNTMGHLYAVWGTGPADAWAVGGVSGVAKIVRWNGQRWAPETSGLTLLQTFGQELHGVWGSGRNDVWAVGIQTSILHWDGAGWTQKGLGPGAVGDSGGDPLNGVWGSAADDVWVVGAVGGSAGGTILHWNGTTFADAQVAGLPALYAVWGSGPSDVTAVGGDGVASQNLAHWDGHAWSLSSTGTKHVLRGVWGRGAGELFVVADGGVILHH